MLVASIIQTLHRRLMSPLDHHHTSSQMYPPWCKRLNHGGKPLNTQFCIIDDEKPFWPYSNVDSSRHKVAIWTRPHPENHSIMSSWFMLSPPCGPSATNHMNCLLVSLKWPHRDCCCFAQNVFCTGEMTEILNLINVICWVGKSLETPRNVIL